MNREIKFRGLRKDGKGWVYGFLVKTINPHKEEKEYWSTSIYEGINIKPAIEIIPESVGQFTGLKDKNNKNAWEGDLREYKGKIYKLVNDVWRLRFERNLVDFGENEDIVIDEDVIFESKLIGNIHENKDLIK
jgi:hypothetical protein